VPLPTYDEFFKRLRTSSSRAELVQHLAIPFESARGCWWGARKHCTFCGLNGSSMAFRSKSPSLVIEELLAMARKHGHLNFHAVDNIIDMRYFGNLLPQLRAAGYDFRLFYETKANLKKEQVRMMSEAGVMHIQPGIESFSTPILKLMEKGTTALQNIRLLKWCAEFGIHAEWNFLYGFPREPVEEYDRMADLLRSLTHLSPPDYFTRISVERFSPYHERPHELGLKITGPRKFYRYVYLCEEATLSDLAYMFDYDYEDGRTPETYVAGVREMVDSWQDTWRDLPFLEYRRGPGFIAIRDRRPGLTAADYSLAGTEAKIYLACDAGATPAAITKTLRLEGETSVSLEDVVEFLDELTEARLMYKESGVYLSLAVPMSPQVSDANRANGGAASQSAFVALTR